MQIDRNEFEAWMQRVLEKLNSLEEKIVDSEKQRQTINGDKLLDNQDLCLMLNVSKRTLQRFRSSGKLAYHHIDQKLYYLESDVLAFIRKHLKRADKKEAEQGD